MSAVQRVMVQDSTVVVAHPMGWMLLLLLILKGPHSGIRDVFSSVSIPSDE